MDEFLIPVQEQNKQENEELKALKTQIEALQNQLLQNEALLNEAKSPFNN
mgnify:FL=1